MNKSRGKIIFLLILVFWILPVFILAQNYTPISPVPGISGSNTSQGGLQKYLGDVFSFVVGLGAALAIIQIAIGGIQYMTSGATGKIESARGRIKDAILGLILLLSTYIILNQINPNILKFRLGPSGNSSDSGDNQWQIVALDNFV